MLRLKPIGLDTVDLAYFQSSHANISGLQLLGREHWEPGTVAAARETYTRAGIYPLFLRNSSSRKFPKVQKLAVCKDRLINVLHYSEIVG